MAVSAREDVTPAWLSDLLGLPVEHPMIGRDLVTLPASDTLSFRVAARLSASSGSYSDDTPPPAITLIWLAPLRICSRTLASQLTPAAPSAAGDPGRADLLAVYAAGPANHNGIYVGLGTALPWVHGTIVLIPDGQPVAVPSAGTPGKPPGQHGLARAWRPQEEEVVPSGGGDEKGAFSRVLSFYV